MFAYDSLPRRKVISSPFNKREIVSYGIIARAMPTGRWIMIQPNYTAALKYVLFGAYRPVHIETLLINMSQHEIGRLKRIIKTVDFRDYEMYYQEITGNLKRECKYSFSRLLDVKNDILAYDESRNPLEPPFGFPKGRSKPGEDTIDVALREFYEEIGTRFKGKIDPYPVDHYEEGVAGRNYRMRCWKCELPVEFSLEEANKTRDIEIKRREWITTDGCTSDGKFVTVTTSKGEKVIMSIQTFVLIK